jgi:hypothetical protein
MYSRALREIISLTPPPSSERILNGLEFVSFYFYSMAYREKAPSD